MGRFMEHFNEEGYDWQATYAKGQKHGDILRIVKGTRRMMSKGITVEEIADNLGEDEVYIREIADIICNNSQFTDEDIFAILEKKTTLINT